MLWGMLLADVGQMSPPQHAYDWTLLVAGFLTFGIIALVAFLAGRESAGD